MNKNTSPENRFASGLKSFITYRLSRVQNRLNAQAAHTLQAHTNLSLTEWRVLSVLCMQEQANAAAICRDAGMDKGQVSRAVNSLMTKGYVASHGHAQDQRSTILEPSKAGRALQSGLRETMQRRQALLTQDISDADLATFYSVLDKLALRAEERLQ